MAAHRTPVLLVMASVAYAAGGWALEGAPAAQAAGNAAMVAAAALVVAAVWRRRRSWAGAQRLFWDVFALGAALWIIGHAGWMAESALFGRQIWLRWHTVFSLCGTVAPLIALLAAPHRGPRTWAVPAVGVDLAVFGLLAVFIYSYFVLVPSLDRSGGSGAQAMLLLLVQANRGVLLLALTAAIALARDPEWKLTYGRIAAGVAIGFVLRFGLSAAIARGEYVPGTIHDLAWIVPWLCYAWAAHGAPASSPEAEGADLPRPAGVGVSAVPVILLPTIGYGVAALAPLGWPIDAFRALLTSVATVGGLALLAIRLTIQRAALQRTDARLRLLAAATEQTADLILILRADGAVEHANLAYLRALGYTRRELAEGQVWPADQDPPVLSPTVTATVRQRGIWRGVVQRRRSDGTTFPSACSVSALRQGGILTHYVAVERDVSEELRLRDQLVHSERLSAIGELVAGVAHEINNPLQTIVGSVELMMDERPGAVNRRDLELVRREAARAGQIVRNLLSFVRRGSADRVVADLNQIVRSTVELREYHLRLENIQVLVGYAPGPLLAVANRDEIQQVVLNLLLNAEHAVASTNRPGVISVTTRTDGTAHAIEVADTGPGIGADLRGRIFEPFFTTKEVGEGTGLGLSISHGIAAAHGGALELVPGEAGACFRLTLPAHRGGARAPDPDPDALTTARRAALVVDDEESIRTLLARLLTRRGYEVHQAATGEAAIERASSHDYGLVLCDMKMPGMDGVELHRRLLALDAAPAPRFVFITGDTSTVDAMRTAAPGVAVLGKPFTAADLDAVLATLR